MRQVIYSVAALAVTMLFSLNVNRGARRTADRVFINEARTQLTGVAYDILENIEQRGVAFDEQTDESKLARPIKFPVVKFAEELTPATDFGGCSDYELCDDIDDFHGLMMTRYSQGMEYILALSVQYVDENDPTKSTPGQSFVKKISVAVTNPGVIINQQPMTVALSRIASYQRITSQKGVWL